MSLSIIIHKNMSLYIISLYYLDIDSKSMLNVAARYCTIYNNPSEDYITRNMFNQLTEKDCKLTVISDMPNSSPSPAKTKKKSNATLVYTVVFSCAGFVLLVITIGIIFLFWRRYKKQIAVNYQNFRFRNDTNN